MPQYNRAELGQMATESGFVRDTFEKVLRLKEILKLMNILIIMHILIIWLNML